MIMMPQTPSDRPYAWNVKSAIRVSNWKFSEAILDHMKNGGNKT